MATRWLFGLLFISFVCAKHEIYDGHAVFNVKVNSVEDIQFVNGLKGPLQLDTWVYAAPGREEVILVAKEHIELFKNELNAKGIEFEIQVENIKELLDLEDRLQAEASSKNHFRSGSSRVAFDRIYNLTEVESYLELLAADYPQVVTLVSAGKSFEGRDIKYLRISTTDFKDTSKPIVFVESLLHAREWVTLPATLYAIHRLVVEVSEKDLVEDIDWIILPIANPDGYEYSHTENRFWRKNRATGYTIGDFCSGVDLNRNFDINWSEASSDFVCTETFHGRNPFSEPETIAIRDIFAEHQGRIELFIDLHSFGSMILYGYGNGELPTNAFALQIGGLRMADAIDAVKASWNRNYVVGNVVNILYKASGSAMDYGKKANVPLSYTYEMPGYRFGISVAGFLVDPDFVEQAGMETWEGIKTGARYARDLAAQRRVSS